MPGCCFVVDYGLGWLARGLERRGFRVYRVRQSFWPWRRDPLKYAARLGCSLVTMDPEYRGLEGVVFVSWEWSRRYNSWEVATKVVKAACGGRWPRGRPVGAGAPAWKEASSSSRTLTLRLRL